MQQVLFTLPIFSKSFPPDGIPMYGFGAMLFVCFVAVTLWGSRRAKRTADMPPERFQDMVIWLFVSGIVGARVLYMIQYSRNFPDQSIGGLIGAFFKIWEGGIIFYGSALGGALGYGLFYWFVLRRLKVNGWQLADAVAPLLALGLAVGRIGCYLNGCCWGQVACEECNSVPLGAAHFPLLPAHARPDLVRRDGLQTTTGFTTEQKYQSYLVDDPRTKVLAVEAGSPAERAGVKPSDRVVKVNGEPNSIYIDLTGPEDKVNAALAGIEGYKKPTESLSGGRTRLEFDDYGAFQKARGALRAAGWDMSLSDRLDEAVREWPRGKSKLALTVEREDESAKKPSGEPGTQTVDLPTFTPVTVGLYPTQLYETVSMALLVLLLLAYYPYRRHDGQLMVLLMLGYSVHRFINESLRIEPTVGLGLTLSQWGSVVIFAAAVGIEIYLRRTMPSRWGGAPGEPVPAPGPVPVGPALATATPSGDMTAPPAG
jgi:prolipoprotein diacylglyceryltransferase